MTPAGALTIGINAQISPRYPGGSETMLLSLLRELGERDGEERFVLCVVPKHRQELDPYMGPNQEVLEWPFPQIGFPYSMQANGCWSRLRSISGPFAPVVATLHRRYRDLRIDLPKDPPARRADPALRARGVDVVHFPYPLRFGTKLPYVYEPWDLQHRHFPDFFPPDLWRWRDRHYRRACRDAALVVTATDWAKQDIVSEYGLAASKVVVIHRPPLLAREELAEADRESHWREHRIPGTYAFYPAMTFPHKNHIRLLQALAGLRDGRGSRLSLVCSGRVYEPHWPAIQAEISRLSLGEQVVFVGTVPEPMLASLYRHARFLIFPSLFEGLGAPLLEAMYHRLPIVASDATCIPEVAGDAAWLFDGHSVESIAGALEGALRQPDRLFQLTQRGARVLQRWSWETAVDTFVASYRFAAGRPLSKRQRDALEEARRA